MRPVYLRRLDRWCAAVRGSRTFAVMRRQSLREALALAVVAMGTYAAIGAIAEVTTAAIHAGCQR